MLKRELKLIENNGAYQAEFIRYAAGTAKKVTWNITAAEAARAAAALASNDEYLIDAFCYSL